jgi:filamentous hemagglutinin
MQITSLTDNLVRRAAEHLKDKGISIEGIREIGKLSRSDARAVEQV